MIRAIVDWWDGIELWLTQLPFGFQVLLAGFVLVPMCGGAAVAVDRVVDVVAAWIAAHRSGDGDTAA